MDDASTQMMDEQAAGPETPEDVAILYSWANLPGAKYRDFSASRREYRAQQRAKIAEQQRQAELSAARELEAAAQREIQTAQRQLEDTRRAARAAEDAVERERAEEGLRNAQRHAMGDKQEALRRQRSAEELRVRAQRARQEMLEARKRAEEQAARYAEADAQYREEMTAEEGALLPGEISDPYYYTGQVDPAFFASTPGVRTAQAGRVSTERRAYVYPLHPGSEEHDSGSLQAYRTGTTFAPSPVQSFRPMPPLRNEVLERDRPDERTRAAHDLGTDAGEDETGYELDDDYYDGGRATRLFTPSQPRTASASLSGAGGDVVIRPVVRQSDEVLIDRELQRGTFAPSSMTVGANAPAQAERPLPIQYEERAGDETHGGSRMFIPSPARRVLPSPPIPLPRDGASPSSQARTDANWRGTPVPRREVALDNRARTTRQPRSESPQPEDMQGDTVDAPVPPAWLSSERPAVARPYVPGVGYQDAGLLGEQDSQRIFQETHGETLGEISHPGAPAPDTLQQSRERVASRWFALKGLMDAPSDVLDSARAMEARTPSLCVMSLSGGVGKTSIVATLGRALSSLGEKVLLADTNTHGLLPYYFGARDLRPGTVRTFTPPSGSPDAPVLLVNYEIEGLGSDDSGQKRIIEDIARRATGTQRVLVDLGSGGTWMARRLARMNPWVLVPIAPDMNSVLSTQTVERLFSDVVDAEGHPVKPYYVLNQYDPSLPLHLDVREVLRQFLGDRLLPLMLHRSPAVSEALAEGMTVIDYAPGSPVTEDYMNLAHWLRNQAAPGIGGARGARWSER